MLAVSFLLLLTSIAAILLGSVPFDRLLRVFHGRHREMWEARGRPTGMFWVPPGSRFFTGVVARGDLAREWLYDTPAWIAESPKLLGMLHRFRWCYAAGMVALVLMMITIFIAAAGRRF